MSRNNAFIPTRTCIYNLKQWRQPPKLITITLLCLTLDFFPSITCNLGSASSKNKEEHQEFLSLHCKCISIKKHYNFQGEKPVASTHQKSKTPRQRLSKDPKRKRAQPTEKQQKLTPSPALTAANG